MEPHRQTKKTSVRRHDTERSCHQKTGATRRGLNRRRIRTYMYMDTHRLAVVTPPYVFRAAGRASAPIPSAKRW